MKDRQHAGGVSRPLFDYQKRKELNTMEKTKIEKKKLLLALKPDVFDSLKQSAKNASMTMTALLNALVVSYLNSDGNDETQTARQAERITTLERQVIEIQRKLNDTLKQISA